MVSEVRLEYRFDKISLTAFVVYLTVVVLTTFFTPETWFCTLPEILACELDLSSISVREFSNQRGDLTGGTPPSRWLLFTNIHATNPTHALGARIFRILFLNAATVPLEVKFRPSLTFLERTQHNTDGTTVSQEPADDRAWFCGREGTFQRARINLRSESSEKRRLNSLAASCIFI